MYPTERLRFIAIQYLIDNVQIYQELDAMILKQLEPIKRKLSNATEQSTRQKLKLCEMITLINYWKIS